MESQHLVSNLVPVGITMSVAGVVVIISINGEKNILKVGDRVNEGDKVVTGLDGEVLLGFADGSHLTLGSSSEVLINSDLYDFSRFGKNVDIPALLKAMQKELLSGKDPSIILESATTSEY